MTAKVFPLKWKKFVGNGNKDCGDRILLKAVYRGKNAEETVNFAKVLENVEVSKIGRASRSICWKKAEVVG